MSHAQCHFDRLVSVIGGRNPALELIITVEELGRKVPKSPECPLRLCFVLRSTKIAQHDIWQAVLVSA